MSILILIFCTIGSVSVLISAIDKFPIKSRPLSIRSHSTISTRLFSKPKNENKRKILKYDNVGDPVYEDELNLLNDGNGINVLGLNIAVDPLTLSLLIFGVIAVNFFVLANL